MTGRTKRWAVSVALAAAVLAATGSLGTPAARAEQKPTETVSASTKSILDEIAGALGFADSNSDGFWEAYAKARAEDLESADRARTDAADQIVRDAATYGRRVEETQGSLTQFVEYIAPASGGRRRRRGVRPNG